MRGFHLLPASLAEFAPRELVSSIFEDTDVTVPVSHAHALYSWMLRSMTFTYPKESPERAYLEMNLKLFLTRHLHTWTAKIPILMMKIDSAY